MRRALGLIVSSLTFLCGAAGAAELTAVPTSAPVIGVIRSGADVLVHTSDEQFHKIVECSPGPVCTRLSEPPPALQRAPGGALPDGGVAASGVGDIRRAWYTQPTRRYDHGVLGDAIEAGGIAVETSSGQVRELVLAESHVFEDLTPRIVDLDRDGKSEVVAIRSSRTGGASVAVLGLQYGNLMLLDATPEIGRRHRWLNIAGFGDFAGRGNIQIAWVETPHIGGTLRFAAFEGGRLKMLRRTHRGLSNHVIGTRELGLSATTDFDGDGVLDLVLPASDRSSLVVVTRDGSSAFDVPGRIATSVATVGRVVVTATEDGTLVALVP